MPQRKVEPCWRLEDREQHEPQQGPACSSPQYQRCQGCKRSDQQLLSPTAHTLDWGRRLWVLLELSERSLADFVEDDAVVVEQVAKNDHSLHGLPTCRHCGTRFAKWQSLSRHKARQGCPALKLGQDAVKRLRSTPQPSMLHRSVAQPFWPVP